MSDASQILALLPALARLNAWARLPYDEQLDMHDLVSEIYRWKNRILKAAMKTGMAKLRIVAVERPCKTCKGTGTYEWHDWNDEDYVDYQDCRRCSDTGKVTLRFVECHIEGFSFHTPRPKWDLGIFEPADWERAESTDWTPEQPGKPMDRVALFESVNEIERALYPPLMLWESWPSPDSITPQYRLNLGRLWSCPFCGRERAAGLSDYGPHSEIYRPGLKWRQCHCWGDSGYCSGYDKPLEWPHDIFPPRGGNDEDRWEYHVPLPELARHPAVMEWLARRGIVIGAYPPDECAWHQCGSFLKVAAVRPDGQLLVRVYGSDDWLVGGFRDQHLIAVPPSSVRTRQRGGPWVTSMPVDYPDLQEGARK